MSDDGTRSWLAWTVVAFGLVAVTVLAVTSVCVATDKQQAVQLVLTAILPLFGTWVGTVLAFYFAKDNLRAATESTLKLQGRESDDTPVSDVMTPFIRIQSMIVPDGQDFANTPLAAARDAMQKVKRQRLPVFSSKHTGLFVLHESTLREFAEKKSQTLASITGSLDDIDKDPVLGKRVRAIAYVPEDATLATARLAMNNVPLCNDVFVTRTGQQDEPVIGWLTNTDLATHQ